MLRTLVLDPKTRELRPLPDGETIRKACEIPDALVWVDVTDPTGHDFEELAHEFGFHPLSIEDCRNRHQRPKVEEYPGYYFIVLYQAGLGRRGRVDLTELDIFLGKAYVVTVHTEPIRAVETAERLWAGWSDLAERGAGLLAYLLIDAIVDEYLPLVDEKSDRLEILERHIFEEFQTESIRGIFDLKKEMLHLRRVVTPLRDVFNSLLRREQPVFSRENLIYFQDVYDHLIRVADSIDTLRDMIGSTMDAYLSISGNRMNMVMKRLTSIATILMSVTLVASIFGMNFDHMPELSWKYGYVGVLAAMLLLAVSLYAYFRSSRWL